MKTLMIIAVILFITGCTKDNNVPDPAIIILQSSTKNNDTIILNDTNHNLLHSTVKISFQTTYNGVFEAYVMDSANWIVQVRYYAMQANNGMPSYTDKDSVEFLPAANKWYTWYVFDPKRSITSETRSFFVKSY